MFFLISKMLEDTFPYFVCFVFNDAEQKQAEEDQRQAVAPAGKDLDLKGSSGKECKGGAHTSTGDRGRTGDCTGTRP